MEPVPPAVEAWILNLWTAREVPVCVWFDFWSYFFRVVGGFLVGFFVFVLSWNKTPRQRTQNIKIMKTSQGSPSIIKSHTYSKAIRFRQTQLCPPLDCLLCNIEHDKLMLNRALYPEDPVFTATLWSRTLPSQCYYLSWGDWGLEASFTDLTDPRSLWGRTEAPQRCPHSNPRTCEYITLHDKRKWRLHVDLKVELRGKEQFQSDPVREGLVWPLPVLKTEGATNQGMQVASER